MINKVLPLIEMMNQQIKIIQGMIILLCTQKENELINLVKEKVLETFNNPIFTETQKKTSDRVENYQRKKRKFK